MRIAFIVQRYGLEILGGSEYHCRLIAERVARHHDVDVLTTCARDYIRWQNEYSRGTERLNGVTVRRFENAETRDIDAFNRFSDWIFHNPHTEEDERSWLRQQGPWCPELLDFLDREHGTYDALIFFTYLYAPTVLGIGIDPARSVLVPTAHDEPAIHLGIYKQLFQKASAIAFNTEVEKAFLKATFEIRARAEETVGCGVDLPDQRAERPGGDIDFCRRHGLHRPFLIYGGRIDPGKGCDELIDYFGTFRDGNGDVSLALMGAKLMPLPDTPTVRYIGMLSERERLQALEAATVVVVPSPLESLSLLALEGMALGTPVLCNARADVLVEHCRRSNAGLFYANRDEFVECATLLVADNRLREQMGRNGRAYVARHYHWDVIMSKYDTLIAALPTRATSHAHQ